MDTTAIEARLKAVQKALDKFVALSELISGKYIEATDKNMLELTTDELLVVMQVNPLLKDIRTLLSALETEHEAARAIAEMASIDAIYLCTKEQIAKFLAAFDTVEKMK